MSGNPALPECADIALRGLQVNGGIVREDGWTHHKTNPYISVSRVKYGAYLVRWNGHSVRAGAGEAYVTPPHHPLAITHHIDPERGFMDRDWLHLSFTVNGVLDVTDLIELPLRLDVRQTAPFGRIITDLLTLSGNAIGVQAQRRELAFRALHLLANLSRPKPAAAELLNKRGTLRAILTHLQEHLEHPIEASGLARIGGISTATLHRQFIAHMGSTPMRYLKGLRLDAACRFLSESDLPLGDVAAKVGFSNAFHFSREFTRRFRSSPAQWRALAQAKRQ